MTSQMFLRKQKKLEILSEEAGNIYGQQKLIPDLMEQIRDLQKQIASLQHWCHLADLEQCFRMNDVIINGLENKPRSYVNAVASDRR